MAKRPETPAQRAARERNLRLSNPGAYSKAAPEAAPPAPREAPRAAPGPPGETVPRERPGSAPGAPRAPKALRGRAPRASVPKAPGASKPTAPGDTAQPTPGPAAPSQEPARGEERASKGGLLDDVIGSVFG